MSALWCIIMTAFNKAWDVLKGTYEEEEADMKRLRAVRDALQRGPPYGNQTGQPEKWPRTPNDPPNPYDSHGPIPRPPNPNSPNPDQHKRPYNPAQVTTATCPKCGNQYDAGMDMATGKPKECPCERYGGSGEAPNPYKPPGAPPTPFQPNTMQGIDRLPSDWEPQPQ